MWASGGHRCPGAVPKGDAQGTQKSPRDWKAGPLCEARAAIHWVPPQRGIATPTITIPSWGCRGGSSATPSPALHPGIAPAGYNQLCPISGGSPSCQVMTPPQRHDSCCQIGATAMPAAQPAATAPPGMCAWGCRSTPEPRGPGGCPPAPGQCHPQVTHPHRSRADPHPHAVNSPKCSFAPKHTGEMWRPPAARRHPKSPLLLPSVPHSECSPGNARDGTGNARDARQHPMPANGVRMHPIISGGRGGSGTERAVAWEAARPAPDTRASVSPLAQPACVGRPRGERC